MHYSLTTDERDLQNGLRAFLSDLVPSATYEAICESESGFSADVWKALTSEGWLDLVPMAEEAGGSAWPISGVVMAEEFGRRPVPVPVELIAGFLLPVLRRLPPNSLGIDLDNVPTDLIACHLGDLRRHIVNGRGPGGLDVRAHIDTEGLVVDGHLRDVQFGAAATSLVLPVLAASGWVFARINLAADGVSVRSVRTVDPARISADILLDGVFVDDVHIARTAAGGGPLDEILADGLLSYLLFLDGKAVGAAMVLLERTISYVQARQQFGVPIGSFQAVKHKVADLATLIESSRSLATYTAWLVSQGAPDRLEAVLSSRLHCADAYRRACELAIQCHGGMGFTWEVGLHVWYRSATYDAAVAGITLDDLAGVVGRSA